jgi:hypothetical protein
MGEAKRRREAAGAAGDEGFAEYRAGFTPDAVFVYAPDLEREAMMTAAGFPTTAVASVVAVGCLHMLRWPKQKDKADRLMSRCTDGLLPIEITQAMPIIALFGDRQQMQRAITDDFLGVNWTEVKRRLPDAPLFIVTIQDLGDRYHFSYAGQLRELARGMGEALARGIRETGSTRH